MNKPFKSSDHNARFMEQSQLEHARTPEIEQIQSFDRATYAKETLERYSGTAFDDFQRFILLTNYPIYVSTFAQMLKVNMVSGPVLNTAHCPEYEMTIIDYQLGAPMAALIMDILSYTKPQCVVMLGFCGGLHRSHKKGDFLLPMAAIRDEGASKHYMPSQVPSLPALLVQQFISQELLAKKVSFKTGVIHTTDYRMWEFDQKFIDQLITEKASAIDMECSTLFTVGFKSKVPVGALMLISDLPLQPGGIKTRKLSETIFRDFQAHHLQCGIDAIQRMRRTVLTEEINFRHFHF